MLDVGCERRIVVGHERLVGRMMAVVVMISRGRVGRFRLRALGGFVLGGEVGLLTSASGGLAFGGEVEVEFCRGL